MFPIFPDSLPHDVLRYIWVLTAFRLSVASFLTSLLSTTFLLPSFYYVLPQSSVVARNITPCGDPIDKYKITMIQIFNMFLIIISTILLT